ncbi:hypothetical protein [Streptomyces virginiae]|uniref:hypothetical protein n=1 Tax=Streptomyces virginiae TaxID=1961 RepID=UPI0036515586
MTTAVPVDHRTPLLALRSAMRTVRQTPEPLTLLALSSAVLALPAESFHWNLEDGQQRVLRSIELAAENPLFAQVDRMDDAVTDLTRMTPSWNPAYATAAMAEVLQLLALCHERQPEMDAHPSAPWSRAAEAGMRLVDIMLRRTDSRPANALMVCAAAKFADRIRTAIAFNAVTGASQLAFEAARRYGLFPIGGRVPMNATADGWTRRIGKGTYSFEVFGRHPEHHPYGRLEVRRVGTDDVRSVPLTARTSHKAITRFLNSL